MLECISIFRFLLIGFLALPFAATSYAADAEPTLFEQNSPYLEYGEFSMGDDEDSETLYYQYGRFFGLSVGAGFQNALGNRGKLYQSAFPRMDLRVHYWFDFQAALVLNVNFANHNFTYNSQDTRVNIIGYGADIKYAFDVKNMGAALSFSNPYIFGGIGALSKLQSTGNSSSSDSDGSLSFSLGGGLEFPIVLKKSYFLLEARYFTQNFTDTSDDDYSLRTPNLSGGFFTLGGHLLFTW